MNALAKFVCGNGGLHLLNHILLVFLRNTKSATSVIWLTSPPPPLPASTHLLVRLCSSRRTILSALQSHRMNTSLLPFVFDALASLIVGNQVQRREHLDHGSAIVKPQEKSKRRYGCFWTSDGWFLQCTFSFYGTADACSVRAGQPDVFKIGTANICINQISLGLVAPLFLILPQYMQIEERPARH